jgi:hypothetical protein
MDTEEAIAAIERRAFAARLTARDLCKIAKVHNVSWSRAKSTKRVSIRTLRAMEEALDTVEKERAA